MVPRPAEADGRRGRAEALPANGGGRELRSLWRRLKEHGDPAARDRLVLHFAPLVKYVAGRMSSALPAHIEEGDLISYGLLGLMNAIERFDPSRQIKFETYAVTRIKGAIIDELRSLDWVPRSVRARARQIERKSADEARPTLGQFWDRFPKFVLGFIAASVIGTLYLQWVPSGKAEIATVNDLRTWFLIFAFVSLNSGGSSFRIALTKF